MPYHLPPVINNLDGTYSLTEDFVFEDSSVIGEGNKIIVPANFKTDYASVPWPLTLFFPKDGRHAIAAVVHDYLYGLARENKFSRVVADAIFLAIMKKSGVNTQKAMVMYFAVRAVGWAVVKFTKKL